MKKLMIFHGSHVKTLIILTYKSPSGWWQFQDFSCSTLFGENSPLWTHIFQIGWFNHQQTPWYEPILPSRELTYPPKMAYLKMIFLFPRGDMLVHQYPLNYVFFGGAYRQEISFFVTFSEGGGMGAVVDVGVSGGSCCFWLSKGLKRHPKYQLAEPLPWIIKGPSKILRVFRDDILLTFFVSYYVPLGFCPTRFLIVEIGCGFLQTHQGKGVAIALCHHAIV